LNILLKIDEGDKLAKQLYDKRIFTGKMWQIYWTKNVTNFDYKIHNFHCIISRLCSFIFLSFHTHRKQCMNDHHNMCNMTSSISILQFLINHWSRFIACNLKANIHRDVISKRCTHENIWNVAENSNGETSTSLWKWRNWAIGLHTAILHQQDVVRQFNVHPSTFSRLLNCLRVTRQSALVNVIDVNWK
jgi:hypothetical protein